MKNQTISKQGLFLAIMVLTFGLFSSCEKTIRTQTFDDILDVSNVEKLTSAIETAETLDNLPVAFAENSLVLPEGLNPDELGGMISFMEKNLKLSSSETDLLLKNDLDTYFEVVDRICSLPPQMESVDFDFGSLDSSDLNDYMMVSKEDPTNLYNDDYYSAIKEYQNLIQTSIIQPLKSIQAAYEKTIPLKSAQLSGNSKSNSEKVKIVIIIQCQNSKEVEKKKEKDKKDKKDKKHKGSKGSDHDDDEDDD
jgi:hypothetical protein